MFLVGQDARAVDHGSTGNLGSLDETFQGQSLQDPADPFGGRLILTGLDPPTENSLGVIRGLRVRFEVRQDLFAHRLVSDAVMPVYKSRKASEADR
jgi:hypothetical protein